MGKKTRSAASTTSFSVQEWPVNGVAKEVIYPRYPTGVWLPTIGPWCASSRLRNANTHPQRTTTAQHGSRLGEQGIPIHRQRLDDGILQSGTRVLIQVPEQGQPHSWVPEALDVAANSGQPCRSIRVGVKERGNIIGHLDEFVRVHGFDGAKGMWCVRLNSTGAGLGHCCINAI